MFDSISTYLGPFVLSILQGVTEFLPVSSSGHLVLLNSFMPTDMGLVFDLVLHLATLVSVLAYYRREVAGICVGAVREIGSAGGGRDNLKFIGYLLAATCITGGIGLCLNDLVESRLRDAAIVGCLMVANAGILWASRRHGLFGMSRDGRINFKIALLIGLFQGLAVLPGISRSGTTITAALLMGVEPGRCALVSFLLSVPVILGAVVLHIGDLSASPAMTPSVLVPSFLLAMAVGYVSLAFLNRMLVRANMHYFAPYCLVVGVAVVCCSLFGLF